MSPPSRLSAALGVAFVCSAAANAYFLLGRRPARAPSAGAVAPAARSGPAPATPSASATAPRPTTRAAPPVPLAATCPGELSAMAERLSAAERELERRLSPEERFERASRTPESEARVQPFLDEVFAGAPASLAHELECHGDACRLTIIESEDADFDWQGRLQTPRAQPLITSMGFRSGAPGKDPVSKEPVTTSLVNLQLAGRDAVSGLDLLDSVLAEVTGQPAFADCKAQHPTAGHLSLRLALDAKTRTIAIDLGGPLASTAGGACMLDVLRQRATAAEATIGPGTLGAVRYATFAVP